jgi:hypothetical protein
MAALLLRDAQAGLPGRGLRLIQRPSSAAQALPQEGAAVDPVEREGLIVVVEESAVYREAV